VYFQGGNKWDGIDKLEADTRRPTDGLLGFAALNPTYVYVRAKQTRGLEMLLAHRHYARRGQTAALSA